MHTMSCTSAWCAENKPFHLWMRVALKPEESFCEHSSPLTVGINTFLIHALHRTDSKFPWPPTRGAITWNTFLLPCVSRSTFRLHMEGRSWLRLWQTQHHVNCLPPLHSAYLLYLNPPTLSEETPTYLSLFFFAFFLSSRSLSSSWANSTISFTFWRIFIPWSLPFSSVHRNKKGVHLSVLVNLKALGS